MLYLTIVANDLRQPKTISAVPEMYINKYI